MSLDTSTPTTTALHPAWLPLAVRAHLSGISTIVDVPPHLAEHPVITTLHTELNDAHNSPGQSTTHSSSTPTAIRSITFHIPAADHASDAADAAGALAKSPLGDPRTDAFTITSTADHITVSGPSPNALLYGYFELLRTGIDNLQPHTTHTPAVAIRMLNHWDNLSVHPVMGQIERGYAGGSIFYDSGTVRRDLSRVHDYARLLASVGINHVAINNVNVERDAARLLTDNIHDVERIAEIFRAWGIRTHLCVSFGSPKTLGGLSSNDPLDQEVRDWWARTFTALYQVIPDFGGVVIKADSEGQPGPFAYGRDHADGANMLSEALAPHGGIVHWRAFVYNHKQDWRDRTTDRARAAYDNFAKLNGHFADNAIVQIKFGPIDFQTREPISPTFAAMPDTHLSLEFQVTQEYTGHQKHICYLGSQWSEIMQFSFWPATNPHKKLADLPVSVTAVSNVGTSEFWTGHPLAQANLYAYGRLTWAPLSDPDDLLTEWLTLTFPQVDAHALTTIHDIMLSSWGTYENYTAPLGVGFMVSPGAGHYGPHIDGYEYSQWGTYHFADRDGVGVDRTRAGTGFVDQYPQELADLYNDLTTCPDELLLFFHHVPYSHVLHSGKTVIQHIYDTHFEGVETVRQYQETWHSLRESIPTDVFAEVEIRLVEQLRCAIEWRDQMCTYFYRKSGVPDAHGRTIY
ncbi:alpha-glucuronidase [Jonesia quinghaiensis]|uniref:alpha-glucuronidase n=1 Tax=Jonesia quinghaiensis TaxID=262806 RepID=UPI0004046DA5|nr:alpha-glucuronidase [Jonesia quinghaiensis]